MRKTKLLDAIIPPGRQRILAATVLQPEREWYVSDLASHLSLRPSSLQRDLARLAEGGVLRRRRDGNRVYFKADIDCPILPELRQILVKTVGIGSEHDLDEIIGGETGGGGAGAQAGTR